MLMDPNRNMQINPRPEHVTSHPHASSSPRYAFSWLHYLPAFVESKDLPTTPLTLKVSRRSLKHVVGKGGHMMARIEDHWGFFILISDCEANFGSANLGWPT